jgi:hypothetical protein
MFGDNFFDWVAGIRGLTPDYAASDGEIPMMVDENVQQFFMLLRKVETRTALCCCCMTPRLLLAASLRCIHTDL